MVDLFHGIPIVITNKFFFVKVQTKLVVQVCPNDMECIAWRISGMKLAALDAWREYYWFRIMCILCTPHTHPSYAHEHIDQHETNVSVHLSTNTWRICQLTYRPTLDWYNDRDMSANVSSDVSTEISAKSRSTYRPTIGRYLGRYNSRHLANTLTIDCWRNIGQLSLEYGSKA